jgi:hypothetical protein
VFENMLLTVTRTSGGKDTRTEEALRVWSGRGEANETVIKDSTLDIYPYEIRRLYGDAPSMGR